MNIKPTWKGSFPKYKTLGGTPVPYDMVRNIGKVLWSYCHSRNCLASSIPSAGRDVFRLAGKVIQLNTTLITLLDTGSLQNSYINQRALAKLKGVDLRVIASGQIRVCGALGGCSRAAASVVIPLTVFNEVKGRDEVQSITAVILETPYELIIGKSDVIKYCLMHILWKAFSNTLTNAPLLVADHDSSANGEMGIGESATNAYAPGAHVVASPVRCYAMPASVRRA